DRHYAYDDDQGQHDGVLDRGRAVFVLQEVQGELTKLTHRKILLRGNRRQSDREKARASRSQNDRGAVLRPARRRGPAAICGGASARGRGDLVADVLERVAGVGAEGADRRDAHHDDQGQHDGVLDRGRAVFVLQEVQGELTKLTHCRIPLCETV